MSQASDYAAAEAAAQAQVVAAHATAPTPHACQYCTVSVETDGQCRIVPGTGIEIIIVSAADALEMANYIIATFGD